MADTESNLAQIIRALRAEGAARVVAVASNRSRHHGTIVEATALPLGAASPALVRTSYGAYLDSGSARLLVLVSDVPLAYAQQPALLPLFEQIARDYSQLVLAAPSIDDALLAMLVVNAEKGTMRVVALEPVEVGAAPALRDLAELASAKVTRVGASLDHGAVGTLPRALITTRETLVFTASRSARTTRVGVLQVGGEDAMSAQANLATARRLLGEV